MISASLITSFLTRLTGALSKGIILVLVFPLAVALLFTLNPMSTLTLIGTTLVIEYGAAPVGIVLGLPPVFIFLVLSSVCLGVMIALYDIFDSLSDHSERIRNFLDRSRKRAAESKILSRYGIYGLVIVALTLGFYLCPPISWVCGWDRRTSIICTMAGYCVVTLALIIAAPLVLVYMPWIAPV